MSGIGAGHFFAVAVSPTRSGSGPDVALSAVRGLLHHLYEEGPDVNGSSSFRFGEPVGAWGDELSSLYRFLVGRPGLVGELRLVQFIQGRQMRPDDVWDLAGEKNEPVCSMCQMASVSLRATSTRATLAPR